MRRSVVDLLQSGGVLVYTSPVTTVAEAARRMAQHNIGSMLVIEHGRRLVGIFTERDLLQRVVVKNKDPETTKIGNVMTRDVIVVASDTPRDEVRQMMEKHHIRHIPVSDGHQILGVISLRDVLRFENAEKEFEIEQLREYILHPGPPRTTGGMQGPTIQS